LVKNAEIPGGMYTNMVAQLKQLKSEEILPRAMELIPPVRLDAGLPPLVTPTSQIVGAQAVSCAMDEKNGKPRYTTKSVQFVNLVKGEYGKTPVAIDPAFREKITGSPVETNFDTSKHQMQPNPVLEQCGGVRLAENEKEVLLLELFPLVAKDFLTKTKCAKYAAESAQKEAEREAEEAARRAAEPQPEPITGPTVNSPLPGRVLSFLVKAGDAVTEKSDVCVLEAMKMENSIAAETAGIVKRLLVAEGDTVAANQPLIELE
jgi:pyruvate/oxaloacetate carboxyltransferase